MLQALAQTSRTGQRGMAAGVIKISARISAHNLRSILKRSYAGVSAPGMEREFVGRLVARPGSRFITTPINQFSGSSVEFWQVGGNVTGIKASSSDG